MVAFIRLAGATIWMAHVRPCTGTTCLACCCDRKNMGPFHGTQDADPNLSDAGIHPSSRKVPVPHYADHAHFQICLCKSLPCLCCDRFSEFFCTAMPLALFHTLAAKQQTRSSARASFQ